MNETTAQRKLVLQVLAICFFVFVFGTFETAPSFLACSKNETHAATETENHDAPVTTLSIPIIVAIHARCGWRIVYNYRDAITAIATALLAVFTFTLWRSTHKLWKSGERALEATERAFISVEPGGVTPYEGGDERIACDVIITNVGNLPARHVAWFIDRKYSADPAENDLPITRCPTGDIVLGKGVEAKKGADPTTKVEFNAMLDDAEPDRAWLYVWGRITYHDGFTPNRAINFCHRYNMRGVANGHTLGPDKARYHEHGNSIDED